MITITIKITYYALRVSPGLARSPRFLKGRYWGITKWLQPVPVPLVITQSVNPEFRGASQPRLALAYPASQMMPGRLEPSWVVIPVRITESQLSQMSQFQVTT